MIRPDLERPDLERPDLERPARAAPPADLPPAAALLDLQVPGECVPGVRDALDALAGHWRAVAAFVAPGVVPDTEPQ